MRIFVLTATYELRVSRKSHLRDHPSLNISSARVFAELPFQFVRHLNRQRRWSSHGQLISNGGRLKPAFSERDKKQTIIGLRGISTTGLKTSSVAPL